MTPGIADSFLRQRLGIRNKTKRGIDDPVAAIRDESMAVATEAQFEPGLAADDLRR